MLCVDQSTPQGQAAAGVAVWPTADLEQRLVNALDFAAVAVSDFGETGYDDAVRPALSFGPEKVVAEAAMLAYAAHGASHSSAVGDRVTALVRQLDPLVRSPRALADMALNPDQVFRRAVPHVLLTAMGHPDDAFDAFASDVCARVLSHAVDQPTTVLAERRWITSVWSRRLPTVSYPPSGTVLTHPFDLLVGSREDPYGLTHLLFYVTDFGRTANPELGRTRDAILAEVEALVLRYLDHGDYDLVGELLMAWPQLHEAWSPVAAFAFDVLAHVEDEVGLLPCGNIDPERLASLAGTERTRYARAASYHTAFVMGFLCAVTLRGEVQPPTAFVAPEYPDNAWRALRAMLDDHPGDWLPVFDRRNEAEKRMMAPMLCGLVITQAMRQRNFATMHDAIRMARQFGLPAQPLRSAAADLLRILSAALQASTPDELEV
ncbi:DUF6895 family protein [Nocardioides bizhenqiangii]|uniref:DUF6895 domain-containing protein n=1 Tax=Nocardioides bizhenqiangii TaxID=3095076 RepID=A0ABZ0ZLB3_9ACTN|nr:hypothetical protein [Nocardioides sp. HM61]WQQ25107.1 hypothetical protein SHK19_14165 [Nocardioides sp. HM61]